MSSIDERLSTLEANDKTLFHQIDELKEDIRDIRRLTVAVEKIAGKVDNIDLKVDTGLSSSKQSSLQLYLLSSADCLGH